MKTHAADMVSDFGFRMSGGVIKEIVNGFIRFDGGGGLV